MKLKRIRKGHYEGPDGYIIRRVEIVGFIDLFNPDRGITGPASVRWHVEEQPKPGRKRGRVASRSRTLKLARESLAAILERSQ